MKKLHFILNPIAGHGTSLEAFSRMEVLLKERHIDYTVYKTARPGHAKELVKAAIEDGAQLVVAAGGDGTVHEVAGAMAHTGIPMGVFPCGTGNDAARPLCIPKEPEAVLHLLLSASPQPVDMGMANGTLFLNVAGFGFDVDVLINTERYKKRFNKGMTAYILGLLRALLKLRLIDIKVHTPDGDFTSRALIAAIANGTHIGGGMNIAPQADPTDGLFDVCIASNVNRLTVFKILPQFIKGKHVGLPVIKYFRCSEISFTSESPVPVQLDGEIIESTPVAFKILPGALMMVTGL
ncbi:diacylglycerol kinase family lipid kinase [Christensenellaceae bacterium OttesenSCG-928-M15]|nr:diacylglycerol kinase family lipid kinase [Christensenellaceae bacterium OttesenSCG-928-M15]